MNNTDWNKDGLVNTINEGYEEVYYVADNKEHLTIGELRQLINKLGHEYDNYYIRYIRKSMDLYGRIDTDYYTFNGFSANRDKGVALFNKE